MPVMEEAVENGIMPTGDRQEQQRYIRLPLKLISKTLEAWGETFRMEVMYLALAT